MTGIDIDNSNRLNGPSSRMVQDQRNIENTGIVASENFRSIVIAFIVIFGFCYSFGMTPLQALYPVEALSYETRGKGVGLTFSIAHGFTLLNQFCFPALKNIGWYRYIVSIVWDLFEASVSYFVSVETKNHTLQVKFPRWLSCWSITGTGHTFMFRIGFESRRAFQSAYLKDRNSGALDPIPRSYWEYRLPFQRPEPFHSRETSPYLYLRERLWHQYFRRAVGKYTFVRGGCTLNRDFAHCMLF